MVLLIIPKTILALLHATIVVVCNYLSGYNSSARQNASQSLGTTASFKAELSRLTKRITEPGNHSIFQGGAVQLDKTHHRAWEPQHLSRLSCPG